MYTVNKGPSKLVAKTRGGLNTFKSIDVTSASSETLATDRLTAPRPVFQPMRKAHNHHHHHNFRDQEEQPPVTPQHEELVKFVQDSWTSLAMDDDTTPTQNGHSSTTNKSSPPKAVYHAESPSDALKDFGAFDLESWWGRRLFNNITKNL